MGKKSNFDDSSSSTIISKKIAARAASPNRQNNVRTVALLSVCIEAQKTASYSGTVLRIASPLPVVLSATKFIALNPVVRKRTVLQFVKTVLALILLIIYSVLRTQIT